MATAKLTLWQRLWYTRLRDALRGRFDASLDWRWVVADAELPAELADAVRQTVGATRLWMGEKVDVARELVAHFQDGLESGRDPAALLATFGDPRQSARLIRRAKKRGRPLVWHFCYYSSMTIGALLFAYVLTGLYMLTGRPTVKTDYLAIINERAESVPADQRAWPHYREALLALGAHAATVDGQPSPFGIAADAEPGDANWEMVEAYLVSHQGAIDELRRAASREHLGLSVGPSWRWFAPEDRPLLASRVSAAEFMQPTEREKLEDRWLISTLCPHLQLMRWSAKVLHNDCRLAVAAGDGATALADVWAMGGIRRHAEETPCLVSLFVANAIQRISYAAIRETQRDRPDLWSDAELRDLAHAVAATRTDWRRGFAYEEFYFDDVLQRLYTDDGHGDGRLAFRVSDGQTVFEVIDALAATDERPHTPSAWANNGVAVLALPAANMVVASRQEMTDVYRAQINSALQKIETPLWEQQELPQESPLLSDQAGIIDRMRYVLVGWFAPAYDSFRNRVADLEGARDGVLVGIGLELYHRQHGAWPESLEALSPRWLPEVPVDRFTGEPLGYKIVDDRPVVYSVGVDRDDDGGRSIATDDGDDRASARHFQTTPRTDATHDGDWVLWSTVPGEEPGAEDEE